MGTLKCTAAIVSMLVGTAVGTAQVVRLGRFVSAVGGIQQAVPLLVDAAGSAEQLEELGPVVTAIGAEILGASAIRRACGT